MPKRDRNTPAASRSPLSDLEAELRSVDRKRRELLRAEGAKPRRFERTAQVTPGAWTDLERTVHLEQAA